MKIFRLALRWEQHINVTLIDTAIWFRHINNITIDNVLRSFQFKILHRILYFNDKLFLFSITSDAGCDFCHEADDSIEHKFWKCRNSQKLWNHILQWYNELTNLHKKTHLIMM